MLFHMRKEFIVFPSITPIYLQVGCDFFLSLHFLMINSESNNAQSEILGFVFFSGQVDELVLCDLKVIRKISNPNVL